MKHLTSFAILSLAALAAGAVDYDLNGDGVVDRADYTLLTNHIAEGGAYSAQYDLDGNGQVDILDANLLLENYTGPVTRTYTVNGVTFKMVAVEGGTFTMGATSEQGSDASNYEKPAHQVTLSNYIIGETEVTQALYQAVMGNNPSHFKGDLLRPVECVNYYDCQSFIAKLNELSGETFRLPTEAEWEYAARGGNQSKGYKYAGSNNAGDVSWYADNSGSTTHQVAMKVPNELGLYDMSGNVWEWTSDWFGYYNSDAQTNPTGPASGTDLVDRGCCWCHGPGRVSDRDNDCPPSRRFYGLGLRLAMGDFPLPPEPPKPETTTYTVNGVSFKMVAVEGGTFTMGATPEQGSDADDDEKPTHQVTLSGYSIGETEVTQALWKAVMGNNPSSHTGNLLYPVESVRWSDCQTFITKLNELTGETFRLPTEAEWEYAARGGNQSKGYKYSGSNNAGDVAWYDGNSSSTTHAVATKSPNELGLYDMSGNVREICADWYNGEYYSSSPSTTPTGPAYGTYRVDRGGTWSCGVVQCRVSDRFIYPPSNPYGDLGFRLAR